MELKLKGCIKRNSAGIRSPRGKICGNGIPAFLPNYTSLLNLWPTCLVNEERHCDEHPKHNFGTFDFKNIMSPKNRALLGYFKKPNNLAFYKSNSAILSSSWIVGKRCLYPYHTESTFLIDILQSMKLKMQQNNSTRLCGIGDTPTNCLWRRLGTDHRISTAAVTNWLRQFVCSKNKYCYIGSIEELQKWKPIWHILASSMISKMWQTMRWV